MAVYLLLGLVALMLGVWLIGLLISTLVDASRPREAAAPRIHDGEDSLETVRRLTEEWQDIRHHWVTDSDPENERRAA